MSAPQRVPPVPAVLRLVQMVVLGRWRATGEDLYREVTRLVEAGPGKEILVSGCGDGVTTEWLATRTRAIMSGVDPDRGRIEQAEERARMLEEPASLIYQQAPLEDLPHEDEVFDAAIGEPTLSASTEPLKAISELVRVTKPFGSIVLMQPTWSSELRTSARELLVERLGMRPRLLVEWKQMMRDAGVVEIQVQDWTSGGPSATGRSSGTGPPYVSTPELTWRQKAQIVGRAWRRRGWREARSAIEREESLLRELSHERALGFQLLKGVKWPHGRPE
ncbi:MAG TPA: methyltransferase domain-containing protein [Gemmatimonadaceae bacterium]|nr:methyltransferase domain-containing protein [Gemmatimonadaceae bacterium]